MSKCFCHFNGYEVKDAAAREGLAQANARLNNLVGNSGEQTDGNLELIDIRTAADGTVYQTAGDSVRGQITDLKSDLSEVKNTVMGHNPNTNYLKKDTFILGYIVDGATDGELVTQNGCYASDFFEIKPNTQYYYSDIHSGYNAFYDENKNFISGFGASTSTEKLFSPFTTPTNAKYMRVSCMTSIISTQNPESAWVFTENRKPDDYGLLLGENLKVEENQIIKSAEVLNPCDYTGDEISVFKKIICIGDSITHGTFNHNENGNQEYITYPEYAYPQYLQKLSGVEVVNKGLGSRTSVMWWNECKNDDFSGYDCAIINLGINDYYQYVSEVDTRQAFANIINALKSANNGIKIFIANIVPAYTEGKTIFDNINAIIRSITENTEDAYLLDMTQYSHCKKDTVYEAGHLSAIGYLRWAKDYHNYISYVISQNLDDFKFVQFIGTDYTYTD